MTVISNTGVRRKPGKDHSDYWKCRLTKRTFKTLSGDMEEVSGWQVYIAHKHTRKWFNTGFSNKLDAAARARDFYRDLVSNGWEYVDKKYSREKPADSGGVTVGQYLGMVGESLVLRPRTLTIYSRKLKTLVSEALSISSGQKHDYVNGGSKEWNQRVERIPLRKLTEEVVQKWIRNRLQGSVSSDHRLAKARVTVNTILRNSKSLFSPKLVKATGVSLPDNFFSRHIELESVRLPRFSSKINYRDLLKKSETLKLDRASGHELYKILLLALTAGLRREEIDRLKWSDVDFDRNRIIVRSGEIGMTKSVWSDADVDIDPTVSELLLGYFEQRSGDYVVHSNVDPKPNALYSHYRCHALFGRLNKWLRKNGVQVQKPTHELRKEFGSQICAQGGIYAATTQLRHSDIRITRDYYVEKTNKITISISHD